MLPPPASSARRIALVPGSPGPDQGTTVLRDDPADAVCFRQADERGTTLVASPSRRCDGDTTMAIVEPDR